MFLRRKVNHGRRAVEYYAPTRCQATFIITKIEVRPANGRSKAISSLFLLLEPQLQPTEEITILSATMKTRLWSR